MKKIIRDYLTFSKKERNAIIVLLIVIIAFIAMPYLFPKKQSIVKPDVQLQQQLSQLQQKDANGNEQKNYASNDDDWKTPYQTSTDATPIKSELFDFDPNTIDVSQWKRLGLRDKTIHTILNYISKGGRFRSPEDIRKVWGIQQQDADRLIPYIKIAGTNTTTSYQTNTIKTPVPTANLKPIDINVATIEQFKALPAVGFSLPYRIIKFREKIGGFVTVDQIKQTWGMTDSVFQVIRPYLKIDPSTVKRININTASEYELAHHPFIDKDVAKAIIVYRTQHGYYKSIDDVKKIVFITEGIFETIAPYISVGDGAQ